jgi:hypothetical protein
VLQFIPASVLFETRQVYEPLRQWTKRTCYISGIQREHLISGKKQLKDGVTGGLVQDAFPSTQCRMSSLVFMYLPESVHFRAFDKPPAVYSLCES